ncbi:MAG: hypothetical protein Q4C91_08305 [Eubacteriales bacterium]|nr:hypothetical protein [Eubacteriales bacterium]
MNRPYVICHILSSLDGKINGPFMAAEARQIGPFCRPVWWMS